MNATEKLYVEKLRKFKIAVSNYFTLKEDMEYGRAYPKENVQHIMDYETDKIIKLLPEVESEIASLEKQKPNSLNQLHSDCIGCPYYEYYKKEKGLPL